jgi:acetate kinase
VACGGARALVLTGGIGANSAPFRARVLDRLGPLGIALDPAANEAAAGPDEGRTISAPGSAFPVLVVPTDEEAAIAEATAGVVVSGPAAG